MDKVTAIVVSWKRQENVRKIIPALRKQTVDPHIVLVNNGEPYEGPEPDDLWQIPFNAGPFIRHCVAYSYDDWLYYNDDDILPQNENLLARMLDIARATDALIVGARARDVHYEYPHYAHRPDTDGWTNNVKGGCMMMHRTVLGRVRFPEGDAGRCDDLHICLEVAKGARLLYVDNSLCSMFEDMDQMGVGLCQSPEHFKERGAYARDWLERCF